MAEKRLKDRLILKLLGLHGKGGIYSEDEAEAFENERAPPAEDAIEKGYLHVITQICTDRKTAEDFYRGNKGMIANFRKATKERTLDLLKTISGDNNERQGP